MGKILLIDAEKCSGCDLCALICSFVKKSLFNPFQARVRVIHSPEKEVSVPMICEQCLGPPCQKACPTDAIKIDPDGNVFINEDKCCGCRLCVLVCPFGALAIDSEKGIAIKCDLCGGNPACALVCPRDAILWVDKTPQSLQKKRELMTQSCEFRTRLPNFYQILGGE